MAQKRPLVLIDGRIQELPATDTILYADALSDHGSLIGLSDDDHTQYYNQSRGDARYAQLGHTHTLASIQQSSANIGDIITWNGTNWVASSPSVGISLTEIVASNQQSTSTTLGDISDLLIPIVANGVYLIDCIVTFQSAATTTGINLGINTPTGCVNKIEITVSVNQNAASAAQLRFFMPNSGVSWNLGNIVGTGVLTINSNQSARITGVIANGSTAGNCKIQFATEVSGSAVTVQSGSYLNLIRVA